MDYNEFIVEVQKNIQKEVHGDISVKRRQTLKNNGCMLDGLLIEQSGERCSPTIYVNEYYRQYKSGRSVHSIVREMLQVYEANKDKFVEASGLFDDYDNVREKIVYKLVSYGRNREMLKDLPHKRYMDFAVVFYCLLENNNGCNATALIHNSHLDLWNISCDELCETAKSNTPRLLPARITRLDRIAGLYSEEDREPFDDILYVITNNIGIQGAACILYEGVMDRFAKRFGRDIIVIPSSVHEMLLIPFDDDYDIKELNLLVGDVNSHVVSEEEVLGDRVLIYRIKEKLLAAPTDI